MKISNLSPGIRRSVAIAVAALPLALAMSQRAYAYGGFWASRTAPVNPSAEEIIFVDNSDSTVTAIIQIKYAGPSQKFAWVIPVPGRPTVGVSSNAVFQRLDAATAPQYKVELRVEGTCRQQYPPDAAYDAGSEEGGAASDRETPGPPIVARGGAPSANDIAAAPVAVVARGSVGPYDYVDVMVDPTLGDPAKVATDWFTTNGYDVTSLDREVLSRYVKRGLDLLAFKLTHDMDAGAIRPIVLTYESKLPVIPPGPAAVAGQGIQVWVIGPSQAVPDNQKSLVINDALIDWLSGRKYVAGTLPGGGVGPFDPYYFSKPSNYDTVVTAAASEAGQGFVTELGAPASQFRDKVWSSMDDQHFAMVSSQSYANGIDAIFAASAYYRDWDGWKDAIEGATTLPADVSIVEFGRNPDQYRAVARVDTTRFFQLLDEEVVRPVADTAAMLYKAPYLTRLYSTVRRDDMRVDPAFNYNADLALISNLHIAKQSIQCTPTLNQNDAPWRIELPHGGGIVGKGSGGWPVAAGSMPANLKVVQLSTTGSGTVVKDNSDDIGTKLFKIAGTTVGGTAMPRPPQNGVMIGGTQAVTPHAETGSTPGNPRPPGGSRCSVSNVGAGRASALALWLPQAGVMLALRRRRRQRGSPSRKESHEAARRV
jgi:Uncharacterized protein conserved in bacteria (DUF2330)